jgi:hypothetical protein
VKTHGKSICEKKITFLSGKKVEYIKKFWQKKQIKLFYYCKRKIWAKNLLLIKGGARVAVFVWLFAPKTF